MDIKSVDVTVPQSVFGRLDWNDYKQTIYRIGFAVASVALGAVITYFKETILPGVSDEAIFTVIVTLVIGGLETLKRTFDGPTQKTARTMVIGNKVPEGYVMAEGLKKIAG